MTMKAFCRVGLDRTTEMFICDMMKRIVKVAQVEKSQGVSKWTVITQQSLKLTQAHIRY